ncbi:alpha/beta hydrolase [Mucilaginibacter sp.]|uniref:alpha/beta fold hydrolase n=1 Tax=Mucilaginibacter sp. TaxID=1882438 RepID=UPI0028434185|nr:alpha/beta hydrolase [Mucilaginibacter sp.]MDR3696731.1 alpha/beta hydrolase [Mucilaginibacter sp.]
MKKYLFLLLLLAFFRADAQTSYYITSADHTKLFVQEFGQGEPVIFLAGGPGFNASYLEPLWKNLASKYRCIVLDQRGTGKSALATMDDLTFTMDNYVNDLEALRAHLKIDKFTLLGHSWGGALAMVYAARYPSYAPKLILLSSTGPTSNVFRYFLDNITMRLQPEDLKEIAVCDSMKRPIIKAILPGYFFDRKRALETKARLNLDDYNAKAENLTWPAYAADENKRVDALKNYKGKVSIIQGRQDPVGESTAYEIKELMPQTNIHFIEKCGHFPWLENDDQASEFFEALNAALN